MNCKAKGNRNEHKTMAILEAAGYACTRSSASLGVFDVVGISSDDIVCVQVKSNQWPGTIEMEMIRDFVVPSNCRKIVHRWRDGQRLPDVREV